MYDQLANFARGVVVQMLESLERETRRRPRAPAVLGVGAQQLRARGGHRGGLLPRHGWKEMIASRRCVPAVCVHTWFSRIAIGPRRYPVIRLP